MVLWVGLNYVSTGQVLPLMLMAAREGVEKSWGPLGTILPIGWDYSFQALFGYRGFFSYSPIFFTAALDWRLIRDRIIRGISRVASTSGVRPGKGRRPRAGRQRRLATGGATSVPVIIKGTRLDRLIVLACVLVIAIHMAIAGGYGGWAYGYRYLIPLTAPFALYAPGVWQRHRRAWAILFVPSFLFALIGSYSPWVPSFQGEGVGNPVAARARFNMGTNIACFALQHDLPGANVLESWFIDTDPTRAFEYEYVFFNVRGNPEVADALAAKRGIR